MHPLFVMTVIAASLAVGSFALPSPDDTILLDNGSQVVSVTLAERSELSKRDSWSCSGSSQCHTMAASDCDCAKRQIQPGNRYFTGGSSGSTGVCCKRCGLFVSGSNCDLTGNEMITAFDELRGAPNNCKICGQKTYSDGCQFKMDVVTGC